MSTVSQGSRPKVTGQKVTDRKVTVRAGSNIAFIKYWGVDDPTINLPQTNSISMTLADAYTTTTLEWLADGGQAAASTSAAADLIELDGTVLDAPKAARLVRHLDRLRAWAGALSPEIDSVTSVWPGADWMEREVYDQFGVRFEGHPDLCRILNPLDWDGHPLRRDYPIGGEEVQFTDAV